MPCQHCKITIIKRSNNESAVSAAAYQSGEKLFSEYDQEQKHYPYKNEVTHKEIMLPPHVPPEYADRNTLWNSAEAQEKQWNSQLARRFVLAIPREIPPEQYADLICDYCREFFVSKGMIADLKEKKAALMEALEQTKEPTIPELLSQYLELRSGQRADWTSRGKLKGTVADYNKVQAAMDFLRKKGISTVGSLDTRLDEISKAAVSVMGGMKKSEKRIKAINTMLSYIDKYEASKPVHAEYAAIGWKKKKEKFAESHREELDAYNAAIRYLKANLKGNSYSRKDLEAEREQLASALPEQGEELEAVQADVKVLRDVRRWLNQVLPSEQYRQTAEPGKKPSVQESLKGRQERIRQEQAGKQKPPRTQKQQNMEL